MLLYGRPETGRIRISCSCLSRLQESFVNNIISLLIIHSCCQLDSNFMNIAFNISAVVFGTDVDAMIAAAYANISSNNLLSSEPQFCRRKKATVRVKGTVTR